MNKKIHILTSALSANFSVTSAVKKILFLILISSSQVLFSQGNNLSDIITSIAEELADEENDPEAIELYVDKLSDLAADPVNLNSADENSLSRLFFLTEFQIKSLADYSHSAGRIYSVYEIANVPGFNHEAAEMIIPFITLESVLPSGKSSGFRNTILSTMTYSSASTDTSFEGSPVRFLSRYRFVSGGFSGGVTAEKDPGEKLFTGKPPVPDFLSSSFEYSGKTFIRKLIIGDYSARFGKGSCINTGWQSGLQLTSTGLMLSRNEVRQYTSAGENDFFRGIAGSFALKDLTWTVFYSQNRLDATLNDSRDRVVSLYTSGLHSTPSMILKKDALTDVFYGINIAYDFKMIRAGITWTEDRLSVPFGENEGDPGKVFDFTGKKNSLYSFYYNSLVNKTSLSGEISISRAGKYAFIQEMSMRLSDRLSVNVLYRKYENGYFSFHGKGTGKWNENSILGNFSFEAAKHLFLSAGCEIRNSSWLKYRSSAPTTALRHEVRLKYLPADDISVELLYNHRSSSYDSQRDRGIAYQETLISDYARCSFRYSPAKNLVLTTRFDYKTAGDSGGALILQDVSFAFTKIPVTIWLRYCLFGTESWDARLYAYENDLLYSFNIPALSGTGSRSYLMVKYEIGKFAELRFKYGLTSQTDMNKEDLRFQLRLFF